MKKLLFIAVACLSVNFAIAQAPAPAAVKFANIDASVADILYFPLRAANVKKEDTSVPTIKIIYSRPQKKGREIFGVLEKFGAVWRLGANESTEITFNKDVKVGDKNINAGRYSMFAIPEKDKWTIIFNQKLDRWGAFSYDDAKDVARISVPVVNLENVIEAFSMTFTPRADGAILVMAWDKTQVELPILFK